MSPPPPLLAAAVLLLGPVFIFLLINYKKRPEPTHAVTPPASRNEGEQRCASRLPPGPRAWPVVGNLLDVFLLLHYRNGVRRGSKHPQPLHAALASLSRTYGPLVHLRLGHQNLVVASSAGAAREVLRTHDRSLAGRAVPAAFRVAKYVDHSMVWSGDDEPRWRRLRGLCRSELLGGVRVDVQAELRERKTGEMVAFLMEEARVGREVKVAEVVFRAVLDMFGLMLMSRDHMAGGFREGSRGPVDWDLKRDFARVLELGEAPNLEDFFPSVFGSWDLQGIRKEVSGIVDRFHSGFRKIVDQRKEDGEKEQRAAATAENVGNDFLDVLLRGGLDGSQLVTFFQDLFIAGIDTTTTCIEWTMAELIKNPDCMSQLKRELNIMMGKPNNCYNNMELTESKLLSLPYLQACIKESLRLHPPAPLLLPHQAKESCDIMSYRVPKGSVVFVNAWAIGRDSKSWGPDALVFNPERFLTDNDQRDFKGSYFDFVPFSSGKRICPGMTLANRIVGLLVSSMVYYFDWKLPRGKELVNLSMEENHGLVLDRKEPLILAPELSYG